MWTVVRRRGDGRGHVFETAFDSELDALIFARCQDKTYWDPWKWSIEVWHGSELVWHNGWGA